VHDQTRLQGVKGDKLRFFDQNEEADNHGNRFREQCRQGRADNTHSRQAESAENEPHIEKYVKKQTADHEDTDSLRVPCADNDIRSNQMQNHNDSAEIEYRHITRRHTENCTRRAQSRKNKPDGE